MSESSEKKNARKPLSRRDVLLGAGATALGLPGSVEAAYIPLQDENVQAAEQQRQRNEALLIMQREFAAYQEFISQNALKFKNILGEYFADESIESILDAIDDYVERQLKGGESDVFRLLANPESKKSILDFIIQHHATAQVPKDIDGIAHIERTISLVEKLAQARRVHRKKH